MNSDRNRQGGSDAGRPPVWTRTWPPGRVGVARLAPFSFKTQIDRRETKAGSRWPPRP